MVRLCRIVWEDDLSTAPREEPRRPSMYESLVKDEFRPGPGTSASMPLQREFLVIQCVSESIQALSFENSR